LSERKKRQMNTIWFDLQYNKVLWSTVQQKQAPKT
jgi:hypothetical protein